MGIVGKIVGGTIGFALGGPLGAILGAVFGHAFDQDQTAFSVHSQQDPLSAMEKTQLTFFVSAFSMLAKLASVDGRVSPKALDTIESFAERDLGLRNQTKEIAFEIFHTALNSPASFDDFAHQFYQHFSNRPELLDMMVDILLRVGLAEGSCTPAQEALIQGAFRHFRMSRAHYEQIKSRYAPTHESAYRVLGCRREDSDETIKSRYRRLVQTYHPDKIIGQGLPDEFVKLAREKFEEIQSAFEAIKKDRGIR